MQWDVLIADDLRLDPAKLPPFVNCARLISTVGVALTAGVFVGLFFLFDASMITELDGKQVCSAMTPLFPGALGISSSQLEDNADMHDSKRETCESYNPPDGPDVKRFTGGLQFDHDVYTARLDVHGTRFYDTEAYRFNVCPISKQVPSAYVLGNYIPDPTVHPNANSQTGMVGKAFSSLVTDGINGDGWDCFNVDFSTESNRDMGVPGLCDVVDDGSRTTFKVMLDPEYPAGTSKPQTATVSGKCDPNLAYNVNPYSVVGSTDNNTMNTSYFAGPDFPGQLPYCVRAGKYVCSRNVKLNSTLESLGIAAGWAQMFYVFFFLAVKRIATTCGCRNDGTSAKLQEITMNPSYGNAIDLKD